MATKVDNLDEFSSVVQALTLDFKRLKGSHSSAEAMLVARTVISSVFADSSPSCAPFTPASQSQPPTSEPKLTKQQRKKARRSDEAKAVANAKRAEYLRAQANALDPNSDANSATTNLGTEQAKPDANPFTAKSPPATPTKHMAPSQLEHANKAEAPTSNGSSEHAKRSRDEVSPTNVRITPTGAPSNSKRAYGSAPKQLVFDLCNIETQDSQATKHNTPPALDSPYAAASAFVEASTRWRQINREGHVDLLERVLSTLSLELQKVDKDGWGKHLNERLGKVAGYECSVAGVRLKVPRG